MADEFAKFVTEDLSPVQPPVVGIIPPPNVSEESQRQSEERHQRRVKLMEEKLGRFKVALGSLISAGMLMLTVMLALHSVYPKINFPPWE